MEPATEDEIQALVDQLDKGRQAWISGHLEKAGTSHMVQAEDMTIFGPFGGGVAWAGPEFEARQGRAASQFNGGAGKCELVKAIAAGDHLVLVMIERSEVAFTGHTEPHPWVLRTTQVFRRDGNRWLRLHRHADPLIRFRALEETLNLLEPAAPAV